MTGRPAHAAHPSCPAATGQGDPPCPAHPDGAHRCTRIRGHVRDETEPAGPRTLHICTCGTGWASIVGGLDELIRIFTRG